MSKVFDDMDRLAEARFPVPETETSKERVLSAEELEKLFNLGEAESLRSPIEPLHNDRETFASGAVRDKVDYRYDLMSPVVFQRYMNEDIYMLASRLWELHTVEHVRKEHVRDMFCRLNDIVQQRSGCIPHLYAQALHESASKYGERNWEQGIPEANLVNHALFHLFKLNEGDTSENHLSHLVWNVMTIIHFREVNADTTKETNQ